MEGLQESTGRLGSMCTHLYCVPGMSSLVSPCYVSDAVVSQKQGKRSDFIFCNNLSEGEKKQLVLKLDGSRNYGGKPYKGRIRRLAEASGGGEQASLVYGAQGFISGNVFTFLSFCLFRLHASEYTARSTSLVIVRRGPCNTNTNSRTL